MMGNSKLQHPEKLQIPKGEGLKGWAGKGLPSPALSSLGGEGEKKHVSPLKNG